MKKWIFYALALAAIPALSFGGFGGQDVGKLQPIQVVMARPDGSGIRILTDAQISGWGTDVDHAIRDMNDSASSQVFLDTADYLLLEADAEQWIPQLREHLRPSCNLCRVSGNVDLTLAGEYLQLHEPKLTVTQYEAGDRGLPNLIIKEGRMKLVQQ